MSLTKRTTRRLSLMTGSSLIAASLSAMAFTGAAIAPTSAQAYDECVPADPPTTQTDGANGVSDPSLNGTTADSFACAPGAYPDGITYTSMGDLTVSVAKGANPSTGGVEATAGQLTDNIALVVTGTGNFSGNSIPSPVMFDLESQEGDISFNMALGNLQAGNAATTHAIRAISEQGGDVSVVVVAGGAFAGGAAGQAGIEARSYGGGDVTVSNAGSIGAQSRLYGILASTNGDGALTIIGGGAISTSAVAPVAGIHATTGTGLLTINATSGDGYNGSAIRTFAGGDAIININGGVLNADGTFIGAASATRSLGILNWTLDASAAVGTRTEIAVNGGLVSGGSTVGSWKPAGQTLRGAGAGEVIVDVNGLLLGAVNFEGLTGTGGEINVTPGGIWRLAGDQTEFSGLGDVVSIAAGGMFQVTPRDLGNDGFYLGAPGLDATAMDFGAGSDQFINSGTIPIGSRWEQDAGNTIDILEVELTLLNLEIFENAGTILFGEYFQGQTTATDGHPDDMLLLPGTTFIGSGDSLLLIDVDLNGAQTACDAAQRDAVTLDLVADCIGIPGGATEGVTQVRLIETTAGDRGAYNPGGIVLVDVSGGTGAQGDFIIDPGSSNYSTAFGGVIDKGLFFFPLVWEADTQQHKLVSGVSGNALQYPLLAQAAHEVWRLATGTWLGRQADLRGDIDEGIGGGVWMRVSGQTTERDLMQSTDLAGVLYDFDNTYQQDSYAVTIGLDVLSGSNGDTAYGIGVMGGYTNSKVEFDTSPNRAQFDGWSLGAYASFISGGLYVDAAVNGNKLIMDHDVPALNLFPVGTVTSTNLASVGGQVEAGWRFPIMQTAFIEPLAGVTYVRSKFDELRIVPDDASRPGVDVEFDDPASLRANIGGRFGLDQDYGGWRAQYSVLGRVWNEFEDETNVVLKNLGDDAFVSNEFTGQFTEVGVGVSLYGLDGAASGFLNLGGMFGDDYQSTRASAGVRVNW